MRQPICLFGWTLALLCALSAGPATAQDIDVGGEWVMTVLGKSPTGEQEHTLTFERNDFDLRVTVKGRSGDVIAMGWVDGHKIQFYYPAKGRRGNTVAKFSGHVRGDLMGGEVETANGNLTTWKAVRGTEDPPDFSGTWTLQMRGESPSGLHLVKMTFRHEGDQLVAVMHGENEEVECEGWVHGRIVTFFYVRPTGDDRFVARFTGQMAGDVMGGEVDMGELGKATWRASRDI